MTFSPDYFRAATWSHSLTRYPQLLDGRVKPGHGVRGGSRSALAAGLVVALMACGPAFAGPWTVVPGESSIGFSGEHAGTKFKGVFQKWEASVSFDPADLAGSKAVVTVALASAKTGDATYDKTLPTTDWFNVAATPSGVFETSTFRAVGTDLFEADATLSIRGVKVPVVFAFGWTVAGDTAKLVGKTALKRVAFGVGKGSDSDGTWVSLDIPVEVRVSLKKG
ncbi:MAG: YceI family protein [Hyphomicrobiaceae bacterium]